MSETLRVLAADDEPLALSRLASLLADEPAVEVIGTACDGRAALAGVRRLSPDLLFLDVEMPHMDGLAVAAALDAREAPEIVILSAFSGYATAAFEVEALDYLLKPVRPDRLRQALERARRRRRERAAHRGERARAEVEATASLFIPGRDGGRHLPLSQVTWIEAARDYVLLHTATRTHILRSTMTELAERLPASMLRVHRSAFVRLDQVEGWGPYVRGARSLVLFDGAQVPVGPSYQQQTADTLRLSHGVEQ